MEALHEQHELEQNKRTTGNDIVIYLAHLKKSFGNKAVLGQCRHTGPRRKITMGGLNGGRFLNVMSEDARRKAERVLARLERTIV